MDNSERFEAQVRSLFARLVGVSLDCLADTNAIGDAMPCEDAEPGSPEWVEALGDALSNCADCEYLNLPEELAEPLRVAADRLWGKASTMLAA